MELEYQENKYRASMMLTTQYPGAMELLRTIYLKFINTDSDEKNKILEKDDTMSDRVSKNKRFTIETEVITDKEAVWEGDRLISFVEDKECIEKLVDLLNCLYDENEKLKKENEELKKELKALRKKYNNFSDTVDKRLKELRE